MGSDEPGDGVRWGLESDEPGDGVRWGLMDLRMGSDGRVGVGNNVGWEVI